eukprot:TRINITY_DN22661_c0_g1_i1.p1 TRINITY_DN22661_c0_g1~~TRINITY_DN22661_c0_g1_i1.p1  ORF type:complete len:261 (-),score=35.90 TRINITY_DN22661_c0_g1_i1:162-944(-)
MVEPGELVLERCSTAPRELWWCDGSSGLTLDRGSLYSRRCARRQRPAGQTSGGTLGPRAKSASSLSAAETASTASWALTASWATGSLTDLSEADESFGASAKLLPERERLPLRQPKRRVPSYVAELSGSRGDALGESPPNGPPSGIFWGATLFGTGRGRYGYTPGKGPDEFSAPDDSKYVTLMSGDATMSRPICTWEKDGLQCPPSGGSSTTATKAFFDKWPCPSPGQSFYRTLRAAGGGGNSSPALRRSPYKAWSELSQ